MVQKNLTPLLFIAGPTAVGKTEVAIALAARLNGEIVSADAFQIYKELNIGTAKPSPTQLKTIAHHLINIISFNEEFNVAAFLLLANQTITDISTRGKIPIVVGGANLFLRVLIHGLFEGPGKDLTIRNNLIELVKQNSKTFLHEKLTTLDPIAASKIHPNDLYRQVRALEVIESTGKPISQYWEDSQKDSKQLSGFKTIKVALIRERDVLYTRAEQRVNEMMDAGLLKEIEGLITMGFHKGQQASHALGYKQLLPVCEGTIDLNTAVAAVKKETRHFIKRQLTWLRHEPGFVWVNLDDSTIENTVNKIGVLVSEDQKYHEA